MVAFTQLLAALDRSTRASAQVAALENYFRHTPPSDAAWALWFLSGRRPKRALKPNHLRQWAAEVADLPLWLVDECRTHVGNLGETLALLLPPNPSPAPPSLAVLIEQRLLPLAGAPETTQRTLLRSTWAELDTPQRFVWHKLLSGTFHGSIPQTLLARALATIAGIDPPAMTHRLIGEWQPTSADFARLLSGPSDEDRVARPYPFFLPSPLTVPPRDLGLTRDWQIEWVWIGIRAQLIRRAGKTLFWSLNEEPITAHLPEVSEAAQALADGTVLDGDLLAWRGNGPLPLTQLQRRFQHRTLSPALLREVPVIFMASDLLEHGGQDIRGRTLAQRRKLLEEVVGRMVEHLALRQTAARRDAYVQTDLFLIHPPTPPLPVALRLSTTLPVSSWNEWADLHRQARETGAPGLMIKRRDSLYGAGWQPDGMWLKDNQPEGLALSPCK